MHERIVFIQKYSLHLKVGQCSEHYSVQDGRTTHPCHYQSNQTSQTIKFNPLYSSTLELALDTKMCEFSCCIFVQFLGHSFEITHRIHRVYLMFIQGGASVQSEIV